MRDEGGIEEGAKGRGGGRGGSRKRGWRRERAKIERMDERSARG